MQATFFGRSQNPVKNDLDCRKFFQDAKTIDLAYRKFSKTPNRFIWPDGNFRRLQIGSFGPSEIFEDSNSVHLVRRKFSKTPIRFIWSVGNFSDSPNQYIWLFFKIDESSVNNCLNVSTF